LQKLMRSWPEDDTETPRAKPTSVTEMARDNTRRRLDLIFYNDWLPSACAEDVDFLLGVLEDVCGARMNLPTALAAATGRDHTYIQVPDEYVTQVNQFIELLRKATREAA
jgi:hypothetical protein